MKRPVALLGMFVLGLGLGAVVPLVRAAPRLGDNKFDNEFLKKFVPTPEKPLLLRVQGAEYQVVGIVEVQDDYVGYQLKSKDAATVWIRIHDVAAIAQPAN